MLRSMLPTVCVQICLQELFAPVVQALVAIGRLFRIRVARIFHPVFE